jgi:DHA1 family bicyclomycin/chloramphenicol resistance-like MFS transporter
MSSRSLTQPDTPATEAPLPDAPPDTDGLRPRLLLVLGALATLPSLSLDAYLPGLPAVARDLGSAQSVAQLTMTACLLGFALGQLFAGPVSDRFGRRRPLVVLLGVYVLATAACALAPSMATLVTVRLVQGMAGSVGMVTANAIVRDRASGAESARAFSMLMLASGVAPILGPVLGGQLLAVTSWRGLFLVLALLGTIVWAAAARAVPETLSGRRRRTGGARETLADFRLLARDRTYLGWVLGRALSAGGLTAYLSGSPFVLQGLHGLSPQGYSAAFAVNSAGLIGFGQIGGRLVRRVGPRRLLVTGIGCCAVGGLALLAVVLGSAGLPLLLLSLFPVVAGMGLVFPNSGSLALEDHPALAGTAAALLGTSQFLLSAVAAPLVGLGPQDSALPMAVVIACFEVAAMAAVVTLPRRARRAAGAG